MRSFTIVLFFVAVCASAQKKVHKVVLNESIRMIQIDADNCYEVILETGNKKEIEVEAQMDGEYSKDLQMRVSEAGNTLILGAGFQPVFRNPNDKLSAHKVVSIALRVVVPKFKNVQIFGNSARVIAYGDYLNLNITLSDGTCELHNVTEEIEVRTQSGNVMVYTAGAKISAETKYGEIIGNPVSNGSSHYKLNSVTGNIIVNKTE